MNVAMLMVTIMVTLTCCYDVNYDVKNVNYDLFYQFRRSKNQEIRGMATKMQEKTGFLILTQFG